MKKLIIKSINNYNYTLVDKNNKEYIINIEFYGLKDKPSINDIIYMNEDIIKDNVLNFESIKENKKINPQEIVVLEHETNRIYLRRIYG